MSTHFTSCNFLFDSYLKRPKARKGIERLCMLSEYLKSVGMDRPNEDIVARYRRMLIMNVNQV